MPRGTLENGEFLYLGPENYNFAVYNNFYSLNNFLLKSQNKVPLVLEWPLSSVAYDSTFNSILPFLVNFGILSPNRVIRVLDVFLSIYMFCSHQRQIGLLSISTDFCQIISLVDSSFLLLVDSGKPLVDSRFTIRN